MPLALLLIGAVLIVSGIRNTSSQLGTLLAGDFSGPGNFFYWVAAIGVIGGVGYYSPLRNASRLFLFLVVLSMLLADKGVFAQLQAAVSSVQPPQPSGEAASGQATTDQLSTNPGSSGGSGSSSSGSGGFNWSQAVSDAAAFAAG